jgi:hypothetical protein
MNSDPCLVVTCWFHLAGVNASANRNLDGPQGISNGTSTADSTSWAVEYGKHSVSGGLDDPSTEATHLSLEDLVVATQEHYPLPVTDGTCASG